VNGRRARARTRAVFDEQYPHRWPQRLLPSSIGSEHEEGVKKSSLGQPRAFQCKGLCGSSVGSRTATPESPGRDHTISSRRSVRPGECVSLVDHLHRLLVLVPAAVPPDGRVVRELVTEQFISLVPSNSSFEPPRPRSDRCPEHEPLYPRHRQGHPCPGTSQYLDRLGSFRVERLLCR